MNGKHSLLIGLVCLSLAFSLILWALPSQSATGTPLPSEDAHAHALLDYQTIRLSRSNFASGAGSVRSPRDIGGVGAASAWFLDLLRLLDHQTIRLSDYQTNPTPTPFSNPTATPPTQGGHGRNLFDLYCMPCHGDVGQGLTDEFRFRQYPPEDTNCWKSGCHGDRPYDNGFKLPKTIPALIGAGALQRFHTAQNMYDFIRVAMPFNKPGSLSLEQYLQLTAFLLEQNHVVADGARLEPAGLQNIVLGPEATPAPTVLPVETTSETPSSALIGIIILLGVAVGLYLIARSRSSQAPR